MPTGVANNLLAQLARAQREQRRTAKRLLNQVNRVLRPLGLRARFEPIGRNSTPATKRRKR